MANTIGAPFVTLQGALSGQHPTMGFRTKRSFAGWQEARILVIDDSVNNGKEMKRVRDVLSGAGLEAHLMAVYASSLGRTFVDSFLELLEYPRLFEWNILDHVLGRHACVDLDGVLCEDPLPRDTCDEEAYRQFIRKVEPLFVPRNAIGWIVTSRLEEYRADTEGWLNKHGIRYKRLIMMQHVTAETRQKFALHSVFKSEVCMDVGALYFIESAVSQARVIARLSQRPCFCVSDMKMYMPQTEYTTVECFNWGAPGRCPKPTIIEKVRTLLRRLGKVLTRRIGAAGLRRSD
jgi:orotate phosphoribosyltransferase